MDTVVGRKTIREYMTPRERVLSSLRHEVTDRIPLHIKAEKEVWTKLREHFGVDSDADVMDALGVDVRTVAPVYVGPEPKRFCDGSYTDVLGFYRQVVSNEYGSYHEYAGFPLAAAQSVEDIESYGWPRPEWWDVSTIPDQIYRINRNTEYCILYEAGSVFEMGWGLRGLEEFLMDMVLRPDISQAILSGWAGFWNALNRRVLEAAGGRIDIAWTWDDVGTQSGPMMSPALWAQQIKPLHVQMNSVLAEYGAKVMYHSCGGIVRFIEGFIDMGVEILNPVQPRPKGMDLPWIKATYGGRIAFHGGIDIQETLPHGTAEQVAAEVKDRILTLGRGGGYILAPAHLIQGDTPVENIVTMYDTARSTPVPV